MSEKRRAQDRADRNREPSEEAHWRAAEAGAEEEARPPEAPRRSDERQEAALAASADADDDTVRKCGPGGSTGACKATGEFLRIAGLDPGTRFEDPHAFVELVEGLLDAGSVNTVLDVPPKPE
jgi:hypothetical protein